MLIQLTISNFTLVSQLEIDFQSGMTSITGETGAGKSIVIDALNMCLGGRSESGMVSSRALRADMCARFSLKDKSLAMQWLKNQELDEDHECLLRRTIGADGRSRGFINGTPVPLSQLRELGQLLIQIHGQHTHHCLLKLDHQKQLLDAYSAEHHLFIKMKNAYETWHNSCRRSAEQKKKAVENDARHQLLEYYLKELNALDPKPEEYEKIEAEHKRLANRAQLLKMSQEVLQGLCESEHQSILSQLYFSQKQLIELSAMDHYFNNLLNMLKEAIIQIKEVSDEIRHYSQKINMEPDCLASLEQHLSNYLDLARKHHVSPERLADQHQHLLDEQQQLIEQNIDQEDLLQATEKQYQQALEIAHELHEKRQFYAKELSALITENMRNLAMPYAKFSIDTYFDPKHLNIYGATRVEFFVTVNPGQPLQPLIKVASGGEISRIALAMMLSTARKMEIPAVIFDEIDVGVSGSTAALMGRLLRQLAASTQVLCITHLPQVAACGHQHFLFKKQSDTIETDIYVHLLDKKTRLEELARLLGKGKITKNTLANAKELLVM
ncbi:DNA repair protein RecN [Candidatus Williamhamiltonella defendens]|uniref:DNA repair protein RecN n=1 Tax=Candidatus Williamhamiltonella endosymbiont of Tuberolachnus salignus TaxID=3077954 RepID=UPI0012A8F9C6|nr:DNA repair protein RecN [Candidatus Hamiltonella defensa]AYB49513.1 DNA repair protein RecN [Candidatus Hamiltonella defensa]